MNWKEIPNYEGIYTISDTGIVKNKKGKVLKQQVNQKGYHWVSLQKNNNPKKFKIHRLVLLAFVGNSNLQTNHKDGNKSNNNISNLEWVTNQQNRDHARKNDLIAKGENSGSAKLNQYEIQAIRKLKNSFTHNEIGKMFKVHQSTITRIINERIWR